MYDYSNGYDDVIDEDKICATNHCDGCPLFQKCYDMSNEVEDDSIHRHLTNLSTNI